MTATSDDRGVATLPALAVGPVKVHVDFPGFEPSESTITLRRGANNQTITLGIAGLQEEVVVNDTSGALDDRSGNAQTTTLEQSEIDALPDDPDELAEVLQQMTGGSGATFQVNGFRGGRLPSRDEIRQIRFRTNSFSADNHDAGRTQIEIITRPNVREWSGNANMGLRERRAERAQRVCPDGDARAVPALQHHPSAARSSPARRRSASASTATGRTTRRRFTR